MTWSTTPTISRPSTHTYSLWVLWAVAIPVVAGRAEDVPHISLHNDATESTSDGQITLEWGEKDLGLIFEVQSARTMEFDAPVIRYHGPDVVTYLSGLENGDHFFRVRGRQADSDVWGPWSGIVHLESEHHSMAFAWMMFSIGAVMFLAITLFVVVNAGRSFEPEERNG